MSMAGSKRKLAESKAEDTKEDDTTEEQSVGDSAEGPQTKRVKTKEDDPLPTSQIDKEPPQSVTIWKSGTDRTGEDTFDKDLITHTTDFEMMKKLLSDRGIVLEEWKAAQPLSEDSSNEEVLQAYQSDIDQILKRYPSMVKTDVCQMRPDNPKREAFRAKFLSEHTHSEEEIRFFVSGVCAFYLNLSEQNSEIIRIVCGNSRLLVLPPMIRHWFDMSSQPCFRAIRFFGTDAGWVANYTESKLSSKYPEFSMSEDLSGIESVSKRAQKRREKKLRKQKLKQQEHLIEQRLLQQQQQQQSQEPQVSDTENNTPSNPEESDQESQIRNAERDEESEISDQLELVYVSETFGPEDNLELVQQYSDVFSNFASAEDLSQSAEQQSEERQQRSQRSLLSGYSGSGDASNEGSESMDNREIGDSSEDHDSQSTAFKSSSSNRESLSLDGKSKGERETETMSDRDNHEHSEDEDEDDDELNWDELSNREKKARMRPSLIKLKKLSKRPDLIDDDDVNAPDPYFLAWLKCIPNSVKVPGHWRLRRKYLQGKRGFLKKTFKLPNYIYDTGISKIRDNRLEELLEQSTKKSQRQRVRPKNMGAMAIDYEILHDAIFKHQHKPDGLTSFGDVYYEGKEMNETRFKQFQPGVISDRLKRALGMVPRYKVTAPNGVSVMDRRINEDSGEVSMVKMGELKFGKLIVWDGGFGDIGEQSHGSMMRMSSPIDGLVGWIYVKNKKDGVWNVKKQEWEQPYPWLINMQRFGPPPSYKSWLKIPGLNHSIPPGREYGSSEGQWGKPPVDDDGKPVYGDPFGIWTDPLIGRVSDLHFVDASVHGSGAKGLHSSKRLWGTLEKYVSDSESDEDDDDDDDEDGGGGQDGNDEQSSLDRNNLSSHSRRFDENELSTLMSSEKTPSVIRDYARSESGSTIGTSAVMSGLTTPDVIQLRKSMMASGGGQSGTIPAGVGPVSTPSSSVARSDIDDQSEPKQLYQVLQKQSTEVRGKFGVDAVYQIPTQSSAEGSTQSGNAVSGLKRRFNADGIAGQTPSSDGTQSSTSTVSSQLSGRGTKRARTRFGSRKKEVTQPNGMLSNEDVNLLKQKLIAHSVEQDVDPDVSDADKRRDKKYDVKF